jgi:hypothetical protein
MKSKIASLMLFASILSVVQLCSAGETKYAPIVQARRSTACESIVERNECVVNLTIFSRSMGGPTLAGTADPE